MESSAETALRGLGLDWIVLILTVGAFAGSVVLSAIK